MDLSGGSCTYQIGKPWIGVGCCVVWGCSRSRSLRMIAMVSETINVAPDSIFILSTLYLGPHQACRGRAGHCIPSLFGGCQNQTNCKLVGNFVPAQSVGSTSRKVNRYLIMFNLEYHHLGRYLEQIGIYSVILQGTRYFWELSRFR